MNDYQKVRVKRLLAVYVGAIAIVLAAHGIHAFLWH